MEIVKLADLKDHPRNYRNHPDDEIEHLMESLREHGFYRNMVIANDGTLLAGHGVKKAALRLGLEEGPAIRLPLDPDEPRAIKVLVADNEIAHLVENDDRLLSELLKQIMDEDVAGLTGTGYDEIMLANLLMVTRNAAEIKDINEAAEWVGMPGYDGLPESPWKIVVNFDDAADRAEFARRLGIDITDRTNSIWFPPKRDVDVSSVKIRADDSRLT